MKGPLPGSFPSGDLTLRGYLYTPEGSGPFPAILWNHGSERHPRPPDELGRFYTSAGYALFSPHRRGHGHSPGEYLLGALPARARALAAGVASYRRTAIELLIDLHQACLEDTIAAASWLGRRPDVDAARIVMSGVSHGGVQTILAAEAGSGARAYVPFSPAATGWRGNPELAARLLRATMAAEAPMFLIQAQNDYSLGPSKILGKQLRRSGRANRVRVYPPYGHGEESGHGRFACQGMAVWGRDVCEFLDQVLTPAAEAA
jgi:carboxymethylenebutenolidase